MEKSDFAKQFSYRLREAMAASEFQASRPVSGVGINQLSEITGYSVQICRRYLRGEALPEPIKLIEIAKKLQVSPGWLLFGEAASHSCDLRCNLIINKNLLRYIFSQAAELYHSATDKEAVSDFLLELIKDVSHINADEDRSKKIIDLAFSSASHFNTLKGI